MSYDPFDAEGVHGVEMCPECSSLNTITYRYQEGFSGLECLACGFLSDSEDIAELTRYTADLREKSASGALPPIPIKKLKA